jgi:hypothetical protein
MQAIRRKNKPQMNGKKSVVIKTLKLPTELDQAVNQNILNQIVNGLNVKKSIDIKEPELQTKEALKRVQVAYLESGGSPKQLIEVSNMYELRAHRIVSEIDFREVSLFEFFLLRQLTARNNERKDPRIKDIAEDILSGKK